MIESFMWKAVGFRQVSQHTVKSHSDSEKRTSHPHTTQPLLIHCTHLLCCMSLASLNDMNTLPGSDDFCFWTGHGPDLLAEYFITRRNSQWWLFKTQCSIL